MNRSLLTIAIAVALGAALGALLGYQGSCTTGGCPLTANPWRGAAYGAVLGLLFALSLPPAPQAPASHQPSTKQEELP